MIIMMIDIVSVLIDDKHKDKHLSKQITLKQALVFKKKNLNYDYFY